jgi:hypothetical protein
MSRTTVLAYELESLRSDLALMNLLFESMRARRDALLTLKSVILNIMTHMNGDEEREQHEHLTRIHQETNDLNIEIGRMRLRRSATLSKISELKRAL